MNGSYKKGTFTELNNQRFYQYKTMMLLLTSDLPEHENYNVMNSLTNVACKPTN